MDTLERYNRLPIVGRILLAPLLVAGAALWGIVLLLCVIVVLLPGAYIQGILARRRFVRSMQREGRMTTWDAAVAQLGTGRATLLIEINPTCHGLTWLIDLPPESLDPEQVFPTWQQFKQYGWDIMPDKPDDEPHKRMERWLNDQLPRHAALAQAVLPTRRELGHLNPTLPPRALLAVPGYLSSHLTRLLGPSETFPSV